MGKQYGEVPAEVGDDKTYYRTTILLGSDQYTAKEWDEFIDWLFDALHDRFCGRDHGPDGIDGICARDFFLGGQVVEEGEL